MKQMKLNKVKTILTKVNYGKEWYGIDYQMNLYRGCSHQCIYCDSRSKCYHIDDFHIVCGKENALSVLEQELSKKRRKGVISFGSMSDPYHPLERQFEQTRGALKLILKYGFGVALDTKSDLILRDLDLLKKINENNKVIVKFTITTPHDTLAGIIEPNVCVSSKRLQAIKCLSQNGIFTGIMMNPVLPFITDQAEDIKKLVRLAYKNKAKFIHTYMGMTLRDRQRDYYFEQLDQHFIGLKQKYIAYYANRYICTVPDAQALYRVFIDACQQYDILYRMEDIIQAYQKDKRNAEQLSLF